SSVSASTGFAPFELNYGYVPSLMKVPVPHTPFKGVRDFAQRALENLERAHDAILESRVNQTFYANQKRRKGEDFKVGDLVYLSTKN
ncbi:hypothetical protein BV25DRAFT_1790067, partial [Artomyces pyxidatus]